MNENLRQSPAGARFTKSFESCLKRRSDGLFVPYYCPAGKLTIGWGHTNDHGRHFDLHSVWTQADCDAAFVDDMAGFELVVRRLVRVQLTQGWFDALVDFAYNAGEGALAGSTLLRKVNAGDFAGAAREFQRWDHIHDPKTGQLVQIRGLTRRRASEMLLAQGIPDANYDGRPDAVAAAVEAPIVEAPVNEAPAIEAAPELMPQAAATAPADKSLVDSKIAQRAVAGAASAAVPVAGQAINAASNATPDPAPTSISDIINNTTMAADAARSVTEVLPAPPKGFWQVVGHLLTDPVVIGVFGVLAILAFAGVIWERNRKLKQEGV